MEEQAGGRAGGVRLVDLADACERVAAEPARSRKTAALANVLGARHPGRWASRCATCRASSGSGAPAWGTGR